MNDPFTVSIDRDRSPAIQPDRSVLEVTGNFKLTLRNDGRPIHVHVRPEGDLGRIADVDATNHYLDTGDRRTIAVRLRNGARPIEGKLKIAAAYGGETGYVTVRLSDPGPADESGVVVDETLTTPATPTTESSTELPRTAIVGTIAVLAVATAIVSIVLFQALAVRLGVIAVLLAVLVALGLLLSPD